MHLDLRELRGSENRIERSYAATAFPIETGDEYAVADCIALSFAVRQDGEKYRLCGFLRTTVQFSCGRCLEPYKVAIALDIDLMYLPYRVNSGEGEFVVSDDDLSSAFYREAQIDLGQLVREQLQLAIPMKPLCSSDCCGLCPVCGISLNVDSCDCETSWVDPRLEGLRALLPRGSRITYSRKG